MQGRTVCLAIAVAVALAGCGRGNNDHRAVERAFHAYVVKAVTGDASLCDEVFSGAEPARFVQKDRAFCRMGMRTIKQRVTPAERRAAAALKPDRIDIRGAIATVSYKVPSALRGWGSPSYFHKTKFGWRIEADAATKCVDGDLSCPT
jgi:hypothetical protein